ncbi:MAG: chromosomal replication initiator protein DnaA [Minisyncoccus archaeiphilus]|uniref:chromosomal replication initiator protein DnaA n=1 Tax=Minisyncoccus archaeiphilus TaxID=3238481 RepID=UPI0009CBDCE0|nr:MAG: Chromosomal replication initiator protein DnaA [Parcubacteria group bacterium ADurb.Bin216]GMX59144.1 MAG: chromosomal replication initiator protein DnaA [Candidatus Parcubacteria bacterium]
MDKEQLWQAVLSQIKSNISEANFATWFNNTRIESIEDEGVTVAVPNSFAKEWLEQKYHKDILKILYSLDSDIKNIHYVVVPISTTKKNIKKEEKISETLTEQLGFSDLDVDKETNLNPKYSFDNFITGPFNEMAYAASMAIIEEPGKNYNPLFIYGGVGLGKTHLIQATGNKIKEKFPDKKIKYIPAEKLISTIVNSIRNQNVEELKRKLREIDVLIVDDIQFIAGKDKTQEEFFHTFNSLYQKNKQIILSSDRHPNNIPAVTERLKSRFEGGMISDITMPEFETRLAILKQKCEEKAVDLPEEVLEFIANNIQRNVRELESALNRLVIYKKANKSPSLEDAKRLLKNIISPVSKVTSYKKITDTIISFYDIQGGSMFTTSRKKEFSKPRQVAMYLMKKELKMSYSEIGRKFGGKDHTTVIHACQLIEKLEQEDEQVHQEIELILQRIYSE